MTLCIVVARYNEDVEWTKQFNNVKIFNKGEPLEPGYNEFFLSNVGREGHTYYKYIYDNYDTLYDYTIFLQGNPFDHSPNIITDLKEYIINRKLGFGFMSLCEYHFDCNLNGCQSHPDLPLIDIYEKLFNERRESMKFMFGGGAQFIVSKQCIRKRPKEFYLKIVEMLQNDIDPIEGYVIERFHHFILQ
jgi:hypothetical protein